MWQQINLHFGFQALWSPAFIIGTIVIAILYFWATGKGRPRFVDSEPVPLYKKILFVFGLFFFYIGYGGPLYLVGHLMFSIHMGQMIVSLLFVPPLIILGTPKWLLKSLVLKIPFKRFFKLFTQPLIAVALFNVMFSFYHIPVIFDYLMVHKLAHDSFQTILFFAAILMWWTIIAPVPEWNRISELQRVGLIFLDGLLLTPACALIIFAGSALYETFTNPVAWATALSLCLPGTQTVSPDLIEQFMLLPLIEDQRLGGVLMKVAQEVLYGSFLIYVFLQWVRRERSEESKMQMELEREIQEKLAHASK